MLTFPNAKINIGLNITAKRNDGYHNLETVFYPIGIQDVLEIKPLENSDKDWDFQIAGQQVTERPEDNLVIKVFKDLQKEFDLPAVDIYLQKKIPTGAGLGGGQNHQPGGGGDREPGGIYPGGGVPAGEADSGGGPGADGGTAGYPSAGR